MKISSLKWWAFSYYKCHEGVVIIIFITQPNKVACKIWAVQNIKYIKRCMNSWPFVCISLRICKYLVVLVTRFVQNFELKTINKFNHSQPTYYIYAINLNPISHLIFHLL